MNLTCESENEINVDNFSVLLEKVFLQTDVNSAKFYSSLWFYKPKVSRLNSSGYWIIPDWSNGSADGGAEKVIASAK